MITDLRLQNFRSYRDESFEFEPGVNIIVGPNASGKTNLLEGVLVIGRGSSYRTKDTELIRHGNEWARLDAHEGQKTRTVKIQNIPDRNPRKTVSINNKTIKRFSLDDSIPMVLFEPDHLLFITGSPQLRRDYLDNLLEQTTNGFAQTRAYYKRTLQQRNALLRKGKKSHEQLFVWNVRLSELGGKIANKRQNLVNNINKSLQNLYRDLASSKNKVTTEYLATCDLSQYGSNMLKKLEASEELDFLRGFTAYGPHRDDLKICIDEFLVSETASRGEIRTMVLCLKIFELKMIEKLGGKKPIILLDDVFSELDGKRRRVLTEHLKGYQTFITTTDADVVAHNFAQKCHVIPIN